MILNINDKIGIGVLQKPKFANNINDFSMNSYDIVIMGGGHNALVAASYLGKAGKKVLLLEKNDYLGGATTSQRVFPDYDAQLSRYSYLMSLFPTQIFRELGLNLPLLPRKIASFTPYWQANQNKGLLISNENEGISRQSILDLGFGISEWNGYQTLCQKALKLAELTWDSFLQPLESKAVWRERFEQLGELELWQEMIEMPIGLLLEKHVQSDLLRGVLMTDAKIGSFTSAHDPSLLQNRTYLYHVVGNKTGEWRVPQGGMGNLAQQLIEKAISAGVNLQTEATVEAVEVGEEWHRVQYRQGGKETVVKARYVLMSALPPQFRWISGQPITDQDEGTAFKINLLLKKLPQLKAPNIDPKAAFSGTFHINQGYEQMEKSFVQAAAGVIPTVFPCEMYCHTLTDPSILSPELQQKGYQTLTVFGIDMAYRLFTENAEARKKAVIERFFEGINAYLAEPLQACLAQNADGTPCIEAKSAVDLEKELGMVRGSIFHGQLSWFFAETPQQTGSWGVETLYDRIYLCGSAALRGGAVSGIAGRNAAMKILGF